MFDCTTNLILPASKNDNDRERQRKQLAKINDDAGKLGVSKSWQPSKVIGSRRHHRNFDHLQETDDQPFDNSCSTWDLEPGEVPPTWWKPPSEPMCLKPRLFLKDQQFADDSIITGERPKRKPPSLLQKLAANPQCDIEFFNKTNLSAYSGTDANAEPIGSSTSNRCARGRKSSRKSLPLLIGPNFQPEPFRLPPPPPIRFEIPLPLESLACDNYVEEEDVEFLSSLPSTSVDTFKHPALAEVSGNDGNSNSVSTTKKKKKKPKSEECKYGNMVVQTRQYSKNFVKRGQLNSTGKMEELPPPPVQPKRIKRYGDVETLYGSNIGVYNATNVIDGHNSSIKETAKVGDDQSLGLDSNDRIEPGVVLPEPVAINKEFECQVAFEDTSKCHEWMRWYDATHPNSAPLPPAPGDFDPNRDRSEDFSDRFEQSRKWYQWYSQMMRVRQRSLGCLNDDDNDDRLAKINLLSQQDDIRLEDYELPVPRQPLDEGYSIDGGVSFEGRPVKYDATVSLSENGAIDLASLIANIGSTA